MDAKRERERRVLFSNSIFDWHVNQCNSFLFSVIMMEINSWHGINGAEKTKTNCVRGEERKEEKWKRKNTSKLNRNTITMLLNGLSVLEKKNNQPDYFHFYKTNICCVFSSDFFFVFLVISFLSSVLSVDFHCVWFLALSSTTIATRLQWMWVYNKHFSNGNISLCTTPRDKKRERESER